MAFLPWKLSVLLSPNIGSESMNAARMSLYSKGYEEGGLGRGGGGGGGGGTRLKGWIG